MSDLSQLAEAYRRLGYAVNQISSTHVFIDITEQERANNETIIHAAQGVSEVSTDLCKEMKARMEAARLDWQMKSVLFSNKQRRYYMKVWAYVPNGLGEPLELVETLVYDGYSVNPRAVLTEESAILTAFLAIPEDVLKGGENPQGGP